MSTTSLRALADHLQRERHRLLQTWRELLVRDPELTTYAGLPHATLEDHFPALIEDFTRRLRLENEVEATVFDIEHRKRAAEHATQRWEVGYDLREALREWGHFQAAVLLEIERYAASQPQFGSRELSAARLELAALCWDGASECGSRYLRLQQNEAVNRLRELESSLGELQKIENERAHFLREAAHDLRGSMSVLAQASSALKRPDVPDSERDRFHELLERRINTLGNQLHALMVWARLEAGEEQLQIERFDAAEKLRELCELMRPLAEERGLLLRCEGLVSLPVESDEGKLHRIVQNLLLNALRATEHGEIRVRWALGSGNNEHRWTLEVHDTGRGFDPRTLLSPGTPNAKAPPGHVEARAPTAAELPSGEGVGLSVVKRLCQLLHVELDIQSAPGQGATIRMTLPLHYSAGPDRTASAEGTPLPLPRKEDGVS